MGGFHLQVIKNYIRDHRKHIASANILLYLFPSSIPWKDEYVTQYNS